MSKQVEFTPERQAQVRKAAVGAKEMLFDLETGKIFLTGRGKLDIHETVMALSFADAAQLAAQITTLGVNTLMQAITAVAAVEADARIDVTKH